MAGRFTGTGITIMANPAMTTIMMVQTAAMAVETEAVAATSRQTAQAISIR